MVASRNLEIFRKLDFCDDGWGTFLNETFFSENRSSIRITRKRVKGPFFEKHGNQNFSKSARLILIKLPEGPHWTLVQLLAPVPYPGRTCEGTSGP